MRLSSNQERQRAAGTVVDAPRAGVVRELVCAALRHSAGAEPADAPAGLHDGRLGDALLRPLLLCAVRRARTHAVHRPATLRS